jgi:hypothetical protein
LRDTPPVSPAGCPLSSMRSKSLQFEKDEFCAGK